MSAQYDLACKPAFQQSTSCAVTLTVPRDMKAPIYVYYQIENMYLNHRRMVLSRSDAQLRGDAGADTLTCRPQRYQNSNSARPALRRFECCLHGALTRGCRAASLPIMPCGLAAWTFFNDAFTFTSAAVGCVCLHASHPLPGCALTRARAGA